MLRRSNLRWAMSHIFAQHKDTDKTPQMRKEVGTWLYNKEHLTAFQSWCSERSVKAYGNVKITTSPHYARCLRTNKKLYPGQGIITLPLDSCFSFLTVAKEMYDVPNNFPLQATWMNYNQRVPYLLGSSHAELVTAGWMCRIHSMDESPYAPFIKWLLEDTRGRDGIANGISKERGDEGSMLDHILSEMATDSCEEPEAFLENLFRSFACVMLRTVPLEVEAIDHCMNGTNFFKAKKHDMFVPALMPLIDCIPQLETGHHNCMVEYYSDARLASGGGRVALAEELEIPELEAPIGKGGLLVLRAITPIEQGDYLTIRSWPKTEHHDQEVINSNVIDAARLINNTDVGV